MIWIWRDVRALLIQFLGMLRWNLYIIRVGLLKWRRMERCVWWAFLILVAMQIFFARVFPLKLHILLAFNITNSEPYLCSSSIVTKIFLQNIDIKRQASLLDEVFFAIGRICDFPKVYANNTLQLIYKKFPLSKHKSRYENFVHSLIKNN